MVRFIHDDRVVGQSAVPIRVIAAGLPRAATSSSQAALERLGFTPCLHMAEIIPHAWRSQAMIDAIREKGTEKRHKLIKKLTEGHVAICDFPVVFFTTDLMDMYPDVKIILNQRRNGHEWLKSAQESLGFFFTWKFWLSGRLVKTDRLWYEMNMVGEAWIKEKFGMQHIWSAETYDLYYQTLREEAAKRGIEVLEFWPEQGWEPLCKYLGKDVPEEDFPRLNEKKAFKIIKTILIARGVLSYAALGLGIWATWRFGPAALDCAKGWLP